MPGFDLVVVGAGIVGLATALAAAARRLRVLVIDREAQTNGASVRNFGFVTVTGQERRSMWSRARRTREIWQQVSEAAGIPILHRGMWMMVRRPESVQVLEAFMATEMAVGCRLLSPAEARRQCSWLRAPELAAPLHSMTELRGESREAVPRIAAWLSAVHGVTFMRSAAVLGVEMPSVHISQGSLRAQRVAICPGDDFRSLYAQRLTAQALTR